MLPGGFPPPGGGKPGGGNPGMAGDGGGAARRPYPVYGFALTQCTTACLLLSSVGGQERGTTHCPSPYLTGDGRPSPGEGLLRGRTVSRRTIAAALKGDTHALLLSSLKGRLKAPDSLYSSRLTTHSLERQSTVL